MSRFNIFSRMHKALSVMLYDTALSLGQASFADTKDAAPALRKLRQLLDVLDKHAENDDDHILPAIVLYEPSLVDTIERARAGNRVLADQLRQLIRGYKYIPGTTERQQAGRDINIAFTAFMDASLAQMANEETVLNKVLWKYYSDMELMVLNQRSVIGPADDTNSNTWLVRGLSNADIVGLLKALQHNAPDSVFNSFFTIAEKELPGIRFHQVMESFTKGRLVA